MADDSISALGYVGFRVSDPDAWSAHATNVLGVMPAASEGDSRRFRIDDQAWRIAVEPGDENDIAFVGFEVPDRAALDAVARRLAVHGVATTPGDAALLKTRGVIGLVHCTDPEGLRVEIYFGPDERQEIPFASPTGVSGFVTGDQGLGHVVLASADIEAVRGFYRDALGLKLSDIISMAMAPGRSLDLEFYHCNPRHHTLALVPAPAPKRLHHFMLQVETLDDVGFALDRALAGGTHVIQTLGRHSNDHMISFYAVTPGGFQVEYGWGAREVDPATWRVVRHHRASNWGHKFQPARPPAPTNG